MGGLMSVFSSTSFDGHEQVVFCHDQDTGLKAIIAIHNTALGPAVGGCRMWAYQSDDEALTDVLRLSRGMTYKNAMAGLDFGGGKAVIIGDSRTQRSEQLFRAFGRFVESLGGRYITAEDVGVGTEDMDAVHKETSHVLGLSGTSGDPSPMTAYGVFRGIEAAVRHKLNRDSLAGLTVGVQGLGHVGRSLCKHLVDAGARLVVADINADAVSDVVGTFGARAVDTATIHAEDIDVFAPCALGAILNDETIPQLKAKVVAGAANNQLAEERHGDMLVERGILYAPDYVINAGGVINIAVEREGYDRDKALARISRIHDTLLEIFAKAENSGQSTAAVADQMARERIMGASKAA